MVNWINNKNKSSVRYSAKLEHYLLIILLSLTAALSVDNDILWRWDNLLYDAQSSFWTRTIPDDIIIIDIDDESLEQIGRWPWPRSVHAEIINKLDLESPRVIALDIIFNEPDSNNPVSDVLLARAMRKSGKVVLPVFMAQESSNGTPIEALPLPEFTFHAAALGHVHIEIDDDGIARRVFLKEGIGEPHWMHYSLAILSVSDKDIRLDVEAAKDGSEPSYSPMQWSREHPFLIPYAGPPGHFNHIGYSQVLAGLYPKDLFRDKIVLIGATAEGMGDALPTPLSGKSGIMNGVEIVANIIDAIRNDIHIVELDKTWLTLLTVLLVALPVALYPYLNPASTLAALFGVVSLTALLVASLLWLFSIWVPLATALLFQVLSYPLWSWRRLDHAMRHINTELDQLTARQKSLSVRSERNLIEEIRFISQFVPIKGWVLQDKKGNIIINDGTIPTLNHSIKSEGWSVDGYRYWSNVTYKNRPCYLGLSMGADAVITDEEIRLLNSLLSSSLSIETTKSHGYVENVLERKIKQVQSAGVEYEELRRIIDDSLSGMADGVLICSSRGQVLLSNHRAGWYLFADDDAEVNGMSLNEILPHVHLKDGENWKALLQRVLFNQERVLTHVVHEDGRDLMVEISPLRIIGDELDGFIINFSDISQLKASENRRTEVLNFLSHDLRSPLASMIAMIELAKNKTSADDIQNMLEGMEKQTNKTLHLAEQFLQLSRANTTENLKFYDIDFNSVVLNAIDQLWALSNKEQVTIEHIFDQEELWTRGEPDLLERAIINLLSNAIKHSDKNSTVQVSVILTQQDITCCVIDQGIGIDADDVPHLFELFQRTKGAGVERIQGIGLGLAFVNAVAKRHAGHVNIESRLGEGSSFCLVIPKLDPEEIVEIEE